jgi:hypothetical protein
MASYYRPNLTDAERTLLLSIIETELEDLSGFGDDRFEERYLLYIKIRDLKFISTDKKPE